METNQRRVAIQRVGKIVAHIRIRGKRQCHLLLESGRPDTGLGLFPLAFASGLASDATPFGGFVVGFSVFSGFFSTISDHFRRFQQKFGSFQGVKTIVRGRFPGVFAFLGGGYTPPFFCQVQNTLKILLFLRMSAGSTHHRGALLPRFSKT